ncbi:MULTISPECIES: DUF7268 family protein [Halomicrobium]|uniref:Uncharacterized protein n=2 Tax=Halomicrobium mukohataei TaxID=57705 RepID=C7NWY6_HALMD|nr:MULTISPECIES: hypothetical protein [Halomicrobium]ACV46351.1 conserved hypothetical protein [Halomicrobium mukohataei DSM 12286]QCD64906.1 hypothetical protein E5139_04365 [Halomicrobium mukohataei]QFR19712.1 hypothetical protein GBQ70_04360 [Halomicrobium sp. ZPS1]
MAVGRTATDWARPRARIVGSALATGALAGPIAVAVLALYAEGTLFGTRKAFALGALAFGFGLLGWSGSVLAGRGVEAMQRHLDAAGDWTEADSRRAMARVTGFGFGAMLGVSATAALL